MKALLFVIILSLGVLLLPAQGEFDMRCLTNCDSAYGQCLGSCQGDQACVWACTRMHDSCLSWCYK